jgi:hypothetical protein
VDVPVERGGAPVIVAGAGRQRRCGFATPRWTTGGAVLDAALADGRRLGANVLATYTAFWQVRSAGPCP